MGLLQDKKEILAGSAHAYSSFLRFDPPIWRGDGPNSLHLLLILTQSMTSKRQLNRDVLISGLALGILYYFFVRTEILLLGGAYLFLCFFWGKLKLANHQFWVKLTRSIQSVTSPILFGAIFVFALLPMGLLFRVFNKREREEDSTFKDIDQTIDASFFEVPW